MKSVWISNLSKEYTPDLALAFKSLGWKAELLSENEMLERLISGNTPHLVIQNVAGRTLGSELAPHEYTVLTLTQEKKIPYAWLMWDSLMHDPALANLEQQTQALSLGLPPIRPMVYPAQDNLYVFTVSKEAVPFLKGAHVEYMPFGVNADRFCPLETPKIYSVGFIGSSLIGSPNDGFYAMNKAGLTPPVHFNDPATTRTWELLCNVRKSAMDRLRACTAVKADVWGNGWEAVAAQNLIKHHGNAAWDSELPSIINAITVNLNISKSCFPHDIAPRVLEILSCGGICVSNRLPGLEAEFSECIDFYDTIEELPEVIAKATKRKGRECILNGWQWTDRAQRIIQVTGA